MEKNAGVNKNELGNGNKRDPKPDSRFLYSKGFYLS